MCVICTEYQMGKITSREAYRAMAEITLTSPSKAQQDHMLEVSDLILSKEVPSNEADSELDAIYLSESKV